MRHFSLEKQKDRELQRDLEIISNGAEHAMVRDSPRWLGIWGWANCAIFFLLLIAMLRVVLLLP
jgi:hypothetical protein